MLTFTMGQVFEVIEFITGEQESAMKRHEQSTVLGKPFFPVGGQAHNSTSYVLEDLRITFDAVRKLNGNS